MEILAVIVAILGLSTGQRIAQAMHCRKHMTYDDDYGYGYDIYCEKLDAGSARELEDIYVYNEIKLTIAESKIANFTGLFRNVRRTKQLFVYASAIAEPRFGELEGLEHLSVVNSDLVNITAATLKGLGKLKELTVMNAKLARVAPGSFQDLQSVERVDFSDNVLGGLSRVPFCEIPQLGHLNVQNNRIALVNGSDFACLNRLKALILDRNEITLAASPLIDMRSLEELSLRFNKIKSLGKALSGTVNVRVLDLQGNELEKVGYEDFANLKRLEALDLSDNNIRGLEEGAFRNTRLEDMKLINNRLASIFLSDLALLEVLDLSRNKLALGDRTRLRNLTSLRALILSRNAINSVPESAFAHIPSLQSLDLSKNALAINQHSFSGLFNLSLLLLSGCSLEALPERAFHGAINLRRLDLSFNALKELRGDLFAPGSKLETLNVSFNALESLHYDAVARLDNLQVLDVEGNRLLNIDYAMLISRLPFLKVINVKSNLLSCEFLTGMIAYFKGNQINYTINEDFQYEKENVAGIYCTETKGRAVVNGGGLQQALINNSALLGKIYEISKSGGGGGARSSAFSPATVAILVALIALIAFMATYRFYVYSKRRHYFVDELELIDS